VDHDEQFDRLARRDAEVTELTRRGRRRTLAAMVVLCVPLPFVVMWSNHDSSLVAVLPVVLGCVVGISSSWSKWRRRPEDAQSVAFLGLHRTARGATYRSLWRGSAIDDPVVLTIVESIDRHLRQSVGLVVATVVTAAALAVLLVRMGGAEGTVVIVALIGLLAAGILGGHRILMARLDVVVHRSSTRA
jgi:hypothetical protein